MSGFNSASNDVGRALRSQKAAMREYENARKAQKQEKGKGGWLVIGIAAIVVYFLLNGG